MCKVHIEWQSLERCKSVIIYSLEFLYLFLVMPKKLLAHGPWQYIANIFKNQSKNDSMILRLYFIALNPYVLEINCSTPSHTLK